jgi:predicted nucleotidyltransferase
MDKQSFSKLTDKLEGLDWFIFSGVAVRIYSETDRKYDDIDLVVRDSDIDKFARRLDAEVKDRDFVKQGNHITDRAFETTFNDIKVEVTTGFPNKRLEEGTLDKIFDNTQEMDFIGQKVMVEPLEELLVHKAKISRDKDRKDLRLLNDLEFEEGFVLELIEDWGLEKERILKILRTEGLEI